MGIALFPHNETAYRSAASMLEGTGKAAVVHPTGTGKSFIAFKLCEEHPDKKVCWLSPSEYIFETQKENLISAGGAVPGNIQFFTYAKLARMEEAALSAIQPDYIVLDEFHRCGAEIWGKGVGNLLRTYPDAPVLGLSATSVRYLDNQRDMADELFQGNVASEMTLGEALVRGILHPPVYVTAVYSLKNELERYRRRVKNARSQRARQRGEQYLEALRRSLENAAGLDEIFQRHLTEKAGKYLVFCANSEHMQAMIRKVPEWFSQVDANPHIYPVYFGDPETSETFAAFKADKSEHLKLLFCIDMLNEGIHVEDVSGVILFRPTVSPIIFKQQIGRALSAGKSRKTVILDIVDNISNLYSIGAIQDEMDEAIAFYRCLGEEKRIVNEQFQILDEVRDCRQLFEQLEQTLSASWDTMYSAAKRYYQNHGNLLPTQRYVTEDGCKLGQWITTQRTNFSKNLLSEARIRRLEMIGMDWRPQKERLWETCYALAEDYYKKHGNLRVPNQEEKLSRWLWEQRRKYREDRLSGEQYQRLTAIGMIWEPEKTWEDKFRAAQSYFEQNGNLDIPAAYVTEAGIALGAWCRAVRVQFQEGVLSQERIQRLEEIGMEWTPVHTRSWMRFYEYAKQYRQEHGDLQVNARYVTADGTRLGAWISSQRYSHSKGRLTQEQTKLLEELGISWQRDTTRWEAGCARAEAYFAYHGHINAESGYVMEDGFPLGTWIATQRRRYETGKLKPTQIKRLEQLNIVWNTNESLWKNAYEHAKAYYAKHGTLSIPSTFQCEDGFKLGFWLINQKTKYKKGLLGKKEIQLLEELAINWTPQKDLWEKGYRHAEQYFAANGNLAVPQKYTAEDGYPLGSWLTTQRVKYRNGKLESREIARLETIGIVWHPLKERRAAV